MRKIGRRLIKTEKYINKLQIELKQQLSYHDDNSNNNSSGESTSSNNSKVKYCIKIQCIYRGYRIRCVVSCMIIDSYLLVWDDTHSQCKLCICVYVYSTPVYADIYLCICILIKLFICGYTVYVLSNIFPYKPYIHTHTRSIYTRSLYTHYT